MLRRLGKLLLKGYILLLTVAAGGIVGANIAGFVPGLVEFASNTRRAPDPEFVRRWFHGGWIVGAGLFLAGAVAHELRSIHRTSGKRAPRRQLKAGQRSDRQDHQPSRSRSDGDGFFIGSKRCGILGSAGVGGVIGGFLGLVLGGSLLMLWFSLAYSPFGLDDWASSITVEKRERPRTGRDSDPIYRVTTRHPVAFYMFGGPIVLGALAGSLFGGAVTTIEQIRNRAESPGSTSS